MTSTSPKKFMIKAVKKQPTPSVAVATAIAPTIEIHSLMVMEYGEDVQLYQGRTRAEMVANYLADGDFECLCGENGPDAEFVADLEAKLTQVGVYVCAPQDFENKTFKHYGEAFAVNNSDSILFQYVVTRL